MARMPLGEPRTVPDPAGDLYDQMIAKLRAKREAEERGSPLTEVGDAFHRFQSGPRLPRPDLVESMTPVVGPAWEAVDDLQDGNYLGAALNGGAAVLDALPVGVAFKGLRAASKGIGVFKEGSLTANAARKAIRRAGMAGPGQEIHHSIALSGTARNAQDFRNHFAFLKTLPTEQHRRLTGSWMGKPRYDPIRRVWYGTTDWMKAIPAGIAGYAAEFATIPADQTPDGASD